MLRLYYVSVAIQNSEFFLISLFTLIFPTNSVTSRLLLEPIVQANVALVRDFGRELDACLIVDLLG